MGEGFELRGGERGLRGLQGCEKVAAAGVRAEGIVDGIHEVVEAQDFARAFEGWARKVAARGDVDLVADRVGDAALEVRSSGGEDAVGARESVGDELAHVANDDLQGGQTIEDSGDNEAQKVQAEFSVPTPAGDGEKHAGVAGEVGVVGLLNDGRWRRGMEIERYVEGRSGFQDGEEFRGVEEFSVRGAVDVETSEAKLADAAFELFNSGGGLFEGWSGEGGEAVGMGADGGGEFIVDIVEDGGLIGGREDVDAHGGEGEDLKTNVALVHGCDAAVTDVEQLAAKRTHALGDVVAKGAGGLEEVGGDEVLFEGDGFHEGLRCGG